MKRSIARFCSVGKLRIGCGPAALRKEVGSSGFFVSGYGLRPLGWEFRMCFAHGRPCACPSDHVHHLPNGPRHNALRANGPGICLAQPIGLGIRVPKRTKGPTARPFARTSSIPNVPLVNLDAMLFAEPPVLVLEGTHRDMIPFGEAHVAVSSRRRCATRLERAIVAWCDYPLLVANGRCLS